MPLALRGFNPPRSSGEGVAQPLRLHLGCGRTILPGWVNVDQVQLPGVDCIADLNACREKRLPFEDDSVDDFMAAHLIEHIPDTLSLMQECHRIAKPGALFFARTPYGSSDDAWEDPTHVRAMFVQSWGYYSQPFFWNKDYSYRGDWQPERVDLFVERDSYSMRNRRAMVGADVDRPQLLNMLFTERNFIREMAVELCCVKPIREPRKELQVLPNINFIFV